MPAVADKVGAGEELLNAPAATDDATGVGVGAVNGGTVVGCSIGMSESTAAMSLEIFYSRDARCRLSLLRRSGLRCAGCLVLVRELFQLLAAKCSGVASNVSHCSK